MPAQNIYDDDEFLAGYVTLDRQVRGLDGAVEWPTFRRLVPDLAERRVVDLGCGFGWLSRWAAERGASSVLGIDLSERMLEQARAMTDVDTIEFRRCDLDVLELATSSADVVVSSLAIHYVDDLTRLMSTIADALTPGGSMICSVEHPIFSAPTDQRFETNAADGRYWPLDNYLVEGERARHWFVDGVVKVHRTVATYVNTMIDAGLTIDRLVEWGPSADDVAVRPELADGIHRPWFLIIRASRPSG